MEKPQYLRWLIAEEGITFSDGMPLTCYRIEYNTDEDILNDWAIHIRKHYINDNDLADGSQCWDMSIEEYLRTFIIPQRNEHFGPTARSSDLSEILFADLLEFILGYTVPRCKQYGRSGKNNSEHGTDVIGYRFQNQNKQPSKADELITVEVKAMLSKDNPADAIASSASDSAKDEQRFAHTLDYYRKKLRFLGKKEESEEIARFMQKTERNYILSHIAGAMASQESLSGNVLVGIAGEDLSISVNTSVFYIHGKQLMNLVHNVYERCIK
jgi:hypothetical protein